MLILVTGANGYIASRLIPRLLESGYQVRLLARRPELLAGRTWLPRVDVRRGDVHAPEGLDEALRGIDSAYYLIHSMANGHGYMRVELQAARNFAAAAERAGVQHIIYLGGLADPQSKHLAPHMRSRMETGETLRAGRVPVTEFRAGVIAGPGSISFEMIRYLTECFPIMPGPRWLRNKAQPIAAANVIDYLLAALDHPEARGGIYEMGGPEVMTYAETMLRYARARGLRRLLFTLPGIPIALMARCVDWLTPVPYSIATPLVGGLESDSIVLDDSARGVFRGVHTLPYQQAIEQALVELNPAQIERVWEGMEGTALQIRHEGFFVDHRRLRVQARAADVYRVFASLGGPGGWLYANWLWRLRGWLDMLVNPQRIRNDNMQTGPDRHTPDVGDLVDYYRVEAIAPDRMMRLHSELRAPGEGWMEWQIEDGVLKQTAFFAPRGLPGFLYWYLLGPLHRLVFRGLIHAIADRSENR